MEIPSKIEDCILLGRHIFYENFNFVDMIDDIKEILKGNRLPSRFIKHFLVLANEKNIDKVIEFAVIQYAENFDLKIKQILLEKPKDYEDFYLNKAYNMIHDNYDERKKTSFWIVPQTIPHPIPFSVNEPLAFSFVKNYSLILARALSIKGDLSDNHIKIVSSHVYIPPFIEKNTEIKEINDNEYKMKEKELPSLMEKLSIYQKKINLDKKNPDNLEKDNDSELHINFIHACSNLIAKNYNIEECDIIKTEMLCDNIIPKIISTTAAITGLASFQLYSLYQTNKIDFIRDCYLNLGINSIIMSEPKSVIKMQDKENDPILLGPVKAIPPGWTVWDYIIINQSMTCGQLIDYIMEKYYVKVFIISSGDSTIINLYIPSHEKRKN